MPIIPSQTQPTVEPTSPAPVFQRVDTPLQAFGVSAQPLANALGQAADVAYKMAMEQQTMQNEAQAREIETTVKAGLSDLQSNPETGYFAKKGRNAVDAYQDAVERAKSIGRDAIGTLTNPAVKRISEKAIAMATENAIQRLSDHATTERGAWLLDTSASRAQVHIQSAANDFVNEIGWRRALEVAHIEAETQGRLLGWPDERVMVQKQKYTDEAVRERAEAWRVQDARGALNWLQTGGFALASPGLRRQLEESMFHDAERQLATSPALRDGVPLPASDAAPTAPNGAVMPRGIRNNNPGNIQRSPEKWQGETDGTDPRYAQFETPEAGLRAMALNLRGYQERHGLDTVAAIASRWAPATENDTAAYAANVAAMMQVKPDAPLDLRDPATMTKLMRAMIVQENGQNPYTDAQIKTGADAALNGTELPVRKVQAFDLTSVTPAQAAAIRTGDPVIDRLPADQRIRVIQLAATQAHQEQTQLRETVNAQLRDEIAALQRGEVSPSRLSDELIIRANGQVKGPELVRERAEMEQFGKDVREVQLLPAAQQAALLAARKPQPGPGYDFSVRRWETLAKAVDQVQKQRTDDPAAFTIGNAMPVKSAYDAFTKALADRTTPGVRAVLAQNFARATLAEQGRLGIPGEAILTKPMIDQIAKQWAAPPVEGVKLANVMDGMIAQWGPFWPVVGKQLRKALPPEAVLIGLGVRPEAEQLLSQAAPLKREQLTAALPHGADVDLKEQLASKFEPLQRSLRYVGGGVETLSTYLEGAEKVGLMLMQNGMKPKDAAAKAFESLAGFKYEFEDEWRVPKETLGGSTTVAALRAGALAARYDVAERAQLALPMAPGGARETDQMKQWRETIHANGLWVTAPGDTGLALYVKSGLGAQPVLDVRGKPIVYDWETLSTLGNDARAAFAGDVYRKGVRMP